MLIFYIGIGFSLRFFHTINRNTGSRIIAGTATVAVAAVLFLAFILFTRSEEDPFAGDAVLDPPFTSLTYGIQAFLWWDSGQVGLHLDWVRLMNFSHVKQIFAWEDMETERGVWDFHRSDAILGEIERRELKLVVRLGDVPEWAHSEALQQNAGQEESKSFIDAPPDDLADWVNFCSTVATRYRGRVAAYQIWNEPNLSREWGNQPPDAEGYIELLRSCSEAIRAADPDAILISAGLAPTGQYDDIAHRDDMYLQAMYNAGFQQYIDVVGAHAPGFTDPEYGPDDAEQDGYGRWATFRRVEDLRKIMMANGDSARQMAILEMGWTVDTVNPDYSWFAVDEETQAANMVAAYRYAVEHWRPWIGLMSAIYIAPPMWTPENEEYWWAITKPNNRMRQAFTDLANMEKHCGERLIPSRDPSGPEANGLVTVEPCD